MGDISNDVRSDDDTAGYDAGVARGLLDDAHQERDLSLREEDRPAERQVLATAWGCWCW